MKTFIIKLISLCIVITAIYLLVTTEYKDDLRKPRKEYDKTGYKLVSDGNLTNTNKSVAENSETGLSLYIDETTSHITLENTNTGQTWTSNVQEKDNFEGIVRSTKKLQQSTLKIWYYNKLEDPKAMLNYEFSIEEQNYLIRYIPNGVEVLYIICDTNHSVYDLPLRISIERMQSLVFDKLDKLIDTGDISAARDKRLLNSNYMYNEKYGIYVLKNPENLAQNMIDIIYGILYEKGDYTAQELLYDNEVQGVSDDKGKPYFEVGVRYTLTDSGFKATIINESLFENKHYLISHIDLLPYFGAGSVNDKGYIVVPDGSGAIMNFNNGKTYATQYEKKLYGKDYGKAVYSAPEKSYNASMPIFGMKKNDDAFLAIITEGDAAASVIADISEKYDSYNKVYARFYCREKDVLPLLGIGNKINMWSVDLNSTDYSIEFRFPEKKDYLGMAEIYNSYLKSLGMKEKENKGLRLNLTFLGGYSDTEHFLGIPYTKVKPLTTTSQVKKITQQLLDDGIKNIDISYRGWMNGGITHSLPNSIDIENSIGGEKGINSLMKFCKKEDINLFFETDFLKINTTDHFKKGKEATRLMSGDVATHYPFNDATLLPDISKNPYWVLNPYSIESNINRMNKEYKKYGLKNISLSDYGNILSGHYDEKKFYYKNETLAIIQENFKEIEDSYNLTMAHSPNIYSTPYLDHIVDLPLESSYYSILDGDIPFYQLAISDSINYAGTAINLDEKHDINWHMLKAIETGSNINFTWSYSDTFNLMTTDYNQYYSTKYSEWYDDAVNLYNELDNLGIYNEKLVEHEIINEMVRRVKYSDGTEIYINYGNTDFDLENLTILANSYTLV
ncbi:hypothetical protein KHQ81_01195 [Mycoplasmatota bacterium]|nr:hypothetical protein KHQ81_01195 [Mycoplasmatota bacterium]